MPDTIEALELWLSLLDSVVPETELLDRELLPNVRISDHILPMVAFG
jgi:hypothetical protein